MAELPAGFSVASDQSFGTKLNEDEGGRDRDRSKPFVGGAIEQDKVRFLSVSQMKLWDPTQFGGCKRRYAFKYKFRVKFDDDTESTRAGRDEYAKGMEDYLKTNEDVLVPVLRAIKHLIPKPGPDLESERPLGEYGAAVTLRDAVLFGGDPAVWERHFVKRLERVDFKIEKATEEGDTERLKGLAIERQWIVNAAAFTAPIPPPQRLAAAQLEIKRLAGLTAGGIPFDGAPDIGHRRGEFISNYGLLTKEDSDKVVAEVGDLKTTRQVNDRTNRKTGEVYKGYSKTVEQVLDDPQMLGYGVAAADRFPDVTHVRLTHIYAQTKPPLGGDRRTGLLPVDELRRRWQRVDALATELEVSVASASSPEDFPYNVASCNSYNRPCPYEKLCKRPTMTVMDSLGLREPGKEKSMGNGLFDLVGGGLPSPPNGTAGAGLFGSVQTPPPPAQTEAERTAAVEAAKAKLMQQSGFIDGIEGYSVGMGCNGLGYYVNQDHTGGHMAVPADHVHNANCQVRVQQPPATGQVNPPDEPPHDPIGDSAPLTKEQIAAIADPELRARAEEHAKLHAARAAADEAAKPKKEKKGGRCPLSGTKMQLTVKETAARPIKKLCTCGKEHKIKPDDIIFEGDTPFFVVGTHNIPKVEEAPATSTAPPAAAQTPATTPAATNAAVPPPPPATSLPPPPPSEPGLVAGTLSDANVCSTTTTTTTPPPAPGIVVGSPTYTTLPPPPTLTDASLTSEQVAATYPQDPIKVAMAKLARVLIDALTPFAKGE